MPPIIMPALSQRLRTLRQSRKIKQEELAAVLQCSLRQYQRVERGEVNVPALTLCALADYFNVTTDYLLGRGTASGGPLSE